MKVVIYQQQNERSRRLCNAMLDGLRSFGEDVELEKMDPQRTDPKGDVAIFYGQNGGGRELLNSYRKAGKQVLYIDMGYWNRKTREDMYGGFHKIALNDLHPTSFQLSARVDSKRFDKQNVEIKPRRPNTGSHILLAGLSGKAAEANGYKPYEWEQMTIDRIRMFSDRKIVYRPKPSWKEAKPIPGTVFSSRAQDLRAVLLNAHCVVTRHSNVAIDALVESIPAYTQHGAAKDICNSFDDLDFIDSKSGIPTHNEIYKFCQKLAYCQWNLEEIRTGEAWRWYRGLIS